MGCPHFKKINYVWHMTSIGGKRTVLSAELATSLGDVIFRLASVLQLPGA